ncbi:hypothetical protein Tco_0791663 [Tanacetum coccineum]
MVCYALSVFASGLAAVVDSDSPSGSVFRLPLFSQVFAISNIRVSVHNMGIPHVKAPAKEYSGTIGQRVQIPRQPVSERWLSGIPGCVTCGQGGTDSLIDHSLELGISDISGCAPMAAPGRARPPDGPAVPCLYNSQGLNNLLLSSAISSSQLSYLFPPPAVKPGVCLFYDVRGNDSGGNEVGADVGKGGGASGLSGRVEEWCNGK